MQADTILRAYVVVFVVRDYSVHLEHGVFEDGRETAKLQTVNSVEIEILVSNANVHMVFSDDLSAFRQDRSKAVLAGNRNVFGSEGEGYGRTSGTERQDGEFLADGSTERGESGERSRLEMSPMVWLVQGEAARTEELRECADQSVRRCGIGTCLRRQMHRQTGKDRKEKNSSRFRHIASKTTATSQF